MESVIDAGFVKDNTTLVAPLTVFPLTGETNETTGPGVEVGVAVGVEVDVRVAVGVEVAVRVAVAVEVGV